MPINRLVQKLHRSRSLIRETQIRILSLAWYRYEYSKQTRLSQLNSTQGETTTLYNTRVQDKTRRMSVLLFTPQGESPMHSMILSGTDDQTFEIKNGKVVRKMSSDSCPAYLNSSLAAEEELRNSSDGPSTPGAMAACQESSSEGGGRIVRKAPRRTASSSAAMKMSTPKSGDRSSQRRHERERVEEAATQSRVHLGFFV